VAKGPWDSLGKRKVSWDREDSEEDSTPTKKRGGKQVRPIVKTKSEPGKKNAARKSTWQPKPQPQDEDEAASTSKPSRRTNKGDPSKLPDATMPGWSHPPKTPSSLEGMVWFYQPPTSGSVQKHARPIASFFGVGKVPTNQVTIERIEKHINDNGLQLLEEGRKFGKLVAKGTKRPEAAAEEEDDGATCPTLDKKADTVEEMVGMVEVLDEMVEMIFSTFQPW
jgi:hypothetical protein